MLVVPPSEGVSNERCWGWELVSFGLCVFSGSFGVRSIVLRKCSGEYMDI